MRRHSAMDFVAGVMVFPGGGVDDRDRNADIAWFGPEPAWWAERFGVDVDLAAGAGVRGGAGDVRGVRRAVRRGRPTTPTCWSTTPRCTASSGPRWSTKSLSFADFLRAEKLVLRADLLRPWANWVTPKEERTRRYDTYFFVGALPEGQRADGENTETDRADWITPQAALDDFADGQSFLLPPTWTQLDSLNGRTRRRGARRRTQDRRRRHRTWPPTRTPATGRSSSSTATATTRPATVARPQGYGRTRDPTPPRMNEFVSVHTSDERPGIATLLLSRPPTNALTRQVYRETRPVPPEHRAVATTFTP